MRRQPLPIETAEEDVDLNPLIDIITMLIVFFVVAGRLSQETAEQITVPPARTAVTAMASDWQRVVITVLPTANDAHGPVTTLRVGDQHFINRGSDDLGGFVALRAMLDRLYDHVASYRDPGDPHRRLPKVVIALRADADTPMRTVQELQQVLTDTVDPAHGMQPRTFASTAAQRAFVTIELAAREVLP